MTIYNEGLDSDFCNFMAEKVKYNLYISVADILTSDLFQVTAHNHYYKVCPLFNFDTAESSNKDDNTDNKKVLILAKKPETMIMFRSENTIIEYGEIKNETIIDDIKYTLYYTYDAVTGEPAPYKQTSNGNITDKNGYYVDSEIIETEEP